jgi:tetratricopeptide (TPR) repeat protein
MRSIGLWCLLSSFVALTSPAMSHQVGGDSYLHMNIADNAMQVQWGIALFSFSNILALDHNNDGKIAPDEAQERLGTMADYALARLTLATAGGVCTLQPGDHEVAGRYAIIRFTPRCPKPLQSLTVEYRLFFDVDPLHRGLLRLEHQGRTHTGILIPSRPTQQIQLAEARPWQQFLEYVVEGIWHIWIGLDHILFLAALLLPAVLRRQGRQWEPVTTLRTALVSVLKIVTSFTVAHSLTLGAAALGVITPPARLVESVIALSVVAAALNNLYPIISAKRMVALTCVFGLIHGFGFASVLQELGLPREALILSLLGFNLGVELGQTAIVGMILPLTYAFRRQGLYRHVVLTFGSLATVGIALLWFVERAFDLPPLLPEALAFDPRAELQSVAPYWLSHVGHPFVMVGSALLIMVGGAWIFLQSGKRLGQFSRWERAASGHWLRYGLVGAVGLIVLGLGMAFSTARQEATLMARAAEVSVQLAEPLRHRLRIAEPRDPVYRAQLDALRQAVTYLAQQYPTHQTLEHVSEVLAQLSAGQTAGAQSLLREATEAAATRGDTAAAAVARHWGAIALVENIQPALEAYRRAVELEPQSWRHWTSLASLLGQAGQQTEAEAAARRALELAQVSNDPPTVGMAYENLAVVSQAKGMWEEAEAMFREALNTYRVLGDESAMARVSSHVGTLYGLLRRPDKALAMYRDALSIHQRLGDQEGMAVTYANIGAVYAARGLFKQGEAMYREALELNETLDRRAGLALVYADLGRLYQRQGDGPQAEAMYRQALAIDEALNYQPGLASHYTNLGLLSRQAGDLAQAAALLRRALSLDMTLGHHLGLAINSATLANVYQMQGDLVQAEAMYQQALAANEQLGRDLGRAANYAHLGHLYRQRGELERAEEMYRQSLALFGTAGVPAGAAQVQAWLEDLQTAPQGQ